MSKSLGTIVDPIDAADRLGVDPLRLYLVKEIPFGGDGDFDWTRYEERYNADLANNLGNLVSRVTAMAQRYRTGVLQPSGAPAQPLADTAAQALRDYREAMDRYALHDGAAAAFRVIDRTNEFIAASEPWALAKNPSNAARLTQVLYDAAEAIRIAAILLLPVMPESATEILRRIGAAGAPRLADAAWRNEGERTLVQQGALWPRKESKTVTDAPGTQAPGTPAPGTPTPGTAAPAERISIDDFMKVELRTAKVLAAERVPKSNKLVKLQVDVGVEQRTLVAGIAEAYEPEQLVGRTVVIVFNLKPAKLMGIESNGMVLAASPDGGKPTLVAFDTPVAPGTRVR